MRFSRRTVGERQARKNQQPSAVRRCLAVGGVCVVVFYPEESGAPGRPIPPLKSPAARMLLQRVVAQPNKMAKLRMECDQWTREAQAQAQQTLTRVVVSPISMNPLGLLTPPTLAAKKISNPIEIPDIQPLMSLKITYPPGLQFHDGPRLPRHLPTTAQRRLLISHVRVSHK